jgi:hypothetical protein
MKIKSGIIQHPECQQLYHWCIEACPESAEGGAAQANHSPKLKYTSRENRGIVSYRGKIEVQSAHTIDAAWYHVAHVCVLYV